MFLTILPGIMEWLKWKTYCVTIRHIDNIFIYVDHCLTQSAILAAWKKEIKIQYLKLCLIYFSNKKWDQFVIPYSNTCEIYVAIHNTAPRFHSYPAYKTPWRHSIIYDQPKNSITAKFSVRCSSSVWINWIQIFLHSFELDQSHWSHWNGKL